MAAASGLGRRGGLLTSVGAWIGALLALGVGLVSLRYLAPGAPGEAPNVVANAFTRYGALTLHAGLASIALIIGPLQFQPRLRARWPRWHRRVGTAYVLCCLGAGLSGLVLALGTTAGPFATAGFGSLALAWLFATANAWRLAKARDFVRHRRWMVRSYALTFAAVTLRIYLPVAIATQMDLAVAYPAISFLCWVPNLIAAEVWLAMDQVKTSRPLASPAQTPG